MARPNKTVRKVRSHLLPTPDRKARSKVPSARRVDRSRAAGDDGRFAQNLNKEQGVATCPICEREVPVWALSAHMEICKGSLASIRNKVEKRHDRRCRKCGKPCCPNYIFCKHCHSHMSDIYEEGI